jgi:hypothetical protein
MVPGEMASEGRPAKYVPNLSAHAALYDCVPARGALVLRSVPSNANGPVAIADPAVSVCWGLARMPPGTICPG